jgi:UDP-sugar pyrophosphorylase
VGDDAFNAYEAAGVAGFGKAAFVLVAGGLGERLGYGGIKVSLPTETTTGRCYLALYMEQILARQAVSNAAAGASDVVPLAIMTSGDTHDATVKLLADNGNFGAVEGQITIIKQEKVGAIYDNDGHLAPSDSDPYSLQTKPHGHGDVHALLLTSGLARKWADEGRTHVVFFQDTNALCFSVSVAALGVSIKEGYVFNSIAVPRKAKDAVGAVTKLVRKDGTSLTINVEYNQLEPMLKASGFPDGDVNDATGFSPFPGNINQLIIALPRYAEVLEASSGLVPEFVNPKYKDATKTTFKKPTRLECMMQDLPRNFTDADAVGFTQFPDWTYSPVKNAMADAKAKMEAGVPGRSAAEGELEFYEAAARQLRAIGCAVAEPEPFTLATAVGDLPLKVGPRIVFSADFAVTNAQLKERFPTPADVKISANSTLVISGDVVIRSLDLDGALEVTAAPGNSGVVEGVTVSNAGFTIEPIASGAAVDESITIRGFTINKGASEKIAF